MNETEEVMMNEQAVDETTENVTVSEPEVTVNVIEPNAEPAEAVIVENATTAEMENKNAAEGMNTAGKPVTEETNQNEAHAKTQPVAVPRTVTEAEWTELVEAHPEIIGQKLPDEIFKACITSEKSPLQVYDSMMLKQTQEQMSYLNAENARLKKELENFKRAPVVPTEGGAPKAEPKDPFLEGFMRYQ